MVNRAKFDPYPYGRCLTHKPVAQSFNMVASQEDAFERMAKGEVQVQCKDCGLWLWPDQINKES